MRSTALILLALLAAAASAAVEDVRARLHEIRAGGCAAQAGHAIPLRGEPALDRAARALASGRKLEQALADAGYRAARSAVLEASGSDAAILRALGERGCADIVDPAWRSYGIAVRGDTVWILLAAPFAPPDAAVAAGRVLQLVNEARAEPRRCGRQRHDAVAPLAPSDALRRAALAHAQDLAAHGALGHAGSDGSTPGERATRAGYRWRFVGENVAAGQQSPEQLVAGWLSSPRHCANIMDGDFAETGIAWAFEPASAKGTYWAQVFGTPRP